MPPRKTTSTPFATGLSKYDTRKFGEEYVVRHDSIVDHDFYNWFRISFEVKKETPNTAILYLNGKDIGEIGVVNNPNTPTVFTAQRRTGSNMPALPENVWYKDLPSAAKAIITNYV